MASILRKLPILDRPSSLSLAGGLSVAVKSNQIVFWISVTPSGLPEFPAHAPRLPAVLDTGFNSTFLLGQEQLEEWANLQTKDLPWTDVLRADSQTIPLRDADVWIHPNQPHARDPIPGRSPFRLNLPEGIGVWPTAIPGSRRLPLLGMRALRRAGLQLHLDGRKGLVSMHTRRWLWFFG